MSQWLPRLRGLGGFPILFGILLAAYLYAPPALAQEFGRVGDVESAGTAYFVYARPGDRTVQVLVVGQGAGIYELSEGTTLDELVALAGGGVSGLVGQEDQYTRRDLTVRVYRRDGESRQLIYEAPMEEMLLEPGQHPSLRDGDLFMIETRTRRKFQWRDATQLFTTFASMALLIDRLVSRF